MTVKFYLEEYYLCPVSGHKFDLCPVSGHTFFASAQLMLTGLRITVGCGRGWEVCGAGS